MSETAATRSIVVERTLAHPPEKVWRALTTAELIATWLMQNDFAPRVGRRFNFRARPIPNMWNGVTDCEVLEVEPPRRLVYSWNASGEEAEGGLKTIVTWTLTPAAGGTHVRMEQAGFRPAAEAGSQAMGGGWPRIVERLGEVAGAL
jgi:uncharacterized protein YndB with AHSA1/START domain